jgi:hypothetical protein
VPPLPFNLILTTGLAVESHAVPFIILVPKPKTEHALVCGSDELPSPPEPPPQDVNNVEVNTRNKIDEMRIYLALLRKEVIFIPSQYLKIIINDS